MRIIPTHPLSHRLVSFCILSALFEGKKTTTKSAFFFLKTCLAKDLNCSNLDKDCRYSNGVVIKIEDMALASGNVNARLLTFAPAI